MAGENVGIRMVLLRAKEERSFRRRGGEQGCDGDLNRPSGLCDWHGDGSLSITMWMDA